MVRPPLAVPCVLALIVLVAAACDSGVSTRSAAASAPGTLAPILRPNETPAPSALIGTPSVSISIDPALLGALPPEIDGHPLDESPEVEQADVEDPTLVGVERLAAAFVHDDNAENWAVVTVVALFRGHLTDEYYRSWRDTFDTGACEPAGGVTGSAVAPIGGREVNVGRCAGGVNTYHVRLPGDRIVSVTSFGPKRYGELVMSGLVP